MTDQALTKRAMHYPEAHSLTIVKKASAIKALKRSEIDSSDSHVPCELHVEGISKDG
jgi:hypothetical protein